MALLGRDIIDGLRQKLKLPSDAEVSDLLGVTKASISHWRNRRAVTARQVIGLMLKAQQTAIRRTETDSIRPIVEFFPIEKFPRGSEFIIFDQRQGQKDPHPYFKGLRDELESHQGVYVFYDSSGRSIYVGKTMKQTLWKEINLAFNRDRKHHQTIRRVYHPTTIRTAYKTTDEKRRQIYKQNVPMHELAAYVSAYAVRDGLISVVEAMLVRGFANDLLNMKMEMFARKPKKRRRKAPVKAAA